MRENQGEFNQANWDQLANQQVENGSANQIPQFTIVPEGGQKQTLQANLKFGQSFYYRGKIIYSDYADPKLPFLIQKSFFQKWFNKLPKMNTWINKSNKYQIVGLTHIQNKGPLLILDFLFVNQQYLLVSIRNLQERKHNFHKQLKDLFLLEFKEKKQNLLNYLQRQEMVVLQANSPILEKYLGDNQQFCIYEPTNILAISEKMSVEMISIKRNMYRTQGKNILKFKGPGWIFFETQAKAPPKLFGQKIITFILIYSILISALELFLTQ